MTAMNTEECVWPVLDDLWNKASTGDLAVLLTLPTGLVATAVIFLATFLFMAITLMKQYHYMYHVALWFEYQIVSVPSIEKLVPMTEAESQDDGVKGEPYLCGGDTDPLLVIPQHPRHIQCYDPSTKQRLGQAVNMTPTQVHDALVQAKAAQVAWSKTTFRQRRLVLRTIQKYICAHVRDICRVSARDSGKPVVDAVLGEILTTCEKIRTICEMGELWLQPDYRPTGPMMMYKTAWVEYVPLGVIVAIAPWNYPFHNTVRGYKNSVGNSFHVLFHFLMLLGKIRCNVDWSFFPSLVRLAYTCALSYTVASQWDRLF
jgi:Aldehyde dehydrogenase family